MIELLDDDPQNDDVTNHTKPNSIKTKTKNNNIKPSAEPCVYNVDDILASDEDDDLQVSELPFDALIENTKNFKNQFARKSRNLDGSKPHNSLFADSEANKTSLFANEDKNGHNEGPEDSSRHSLFDNTSKEKHLRTNMIDDFLSDDSVDWQLDELDKQRADKQKISASLNNSQFLTSKEPAATIGWVSTPVKKRVAKISTDNNTTSKGIPSNAYSNEKLFLSSSQTSFNDDEVNTPHVSNTQRSKSKPMESENNIISSNPLSPIKANSSLDLMSSWPENTQPVKITQEETKAHNRLPFDFSSDDEELGIDFRERKSSFRRNSSTAGSQLPTFEQLIEDRINSQSVLKKKPEAKHELVELLSSGNELSEEDNDIIFRSNKPKLPESKTKRPLSSTKCGATLQLFSSSLPSDPIDSTDISFLDISPVRAESKSNSKAVRKSRTYPNITKQPSSKVNTNAYMDGHDNYLSQFTKKVLTQANKTKRNKAEISAEMILNADAEIIKQLGATKDTLILQFDPSKIREIELAQVLKEHISTIEHIERQSLQGVEISDKNVQLSILTTKFKLITWSRITDKVFSDTYSCFLPLDGPVNVLEDVAGIFYNAEDFICSYQSKEFLIELANFKKQFVPAVFKQVVLILKGYDNFISKIKRKRNQEYVNRVRNYMSREELEALQATEQQQQRKRRKKNALTDELNLTVDEIESIVLETQIEHNVYAFTINSTADLLMWLKSFTFSVGQQFYDHIAWKKNSFFNEFGPIKSGDTPQDSLKLALQQFKYVSATQSKQIVDKYPTILKLYNATTSRNTLGRDYNGRQLVNSRVDSLLVNLFKSDDPDNLLMDD